MGTVAVFFFRGSKIALGGHTSMKHLPASFVADCRRRLLATKAELLNQLHAGRDHLSRTERLSDTTDMSTRLIEENEIVSLQGHWRRQLYEIELALHRIDAGKYGVCEETEEPIEMSRLGALPWTRYSLEGAELLETR